MGSYHLAISFLVPALSFTATWSEANTIRMGCHTAGLVVGEARVQGYVCVVLVLCVTNLDQVSRTWQNLISGEASFTQRLECSKVVEETRDEKKVHT